MAARSLPTLTQADSDSAADRRLPSACKRTFEEQPDSWYRAPESWPEDRGIKRFGDGSIYSVHSMLMDLSAAPPIAEEVVESTGARCERRRLGSSTPCYIRVRYPHTRHLTVFLYSDFSLPELGQSKPLGRILDEVVFIAYDTNHDDEGSEKAVYWIGNKGSFASDYFSGHAASRSQIAQSSIVSG